MPVLVFALAAALQSAPTPDPRPVWVVQPRPWYPEAALGADIKAGRVDLRCTFVNQRATDCTVVSETPQGYGFGRAALAAMSRAVASPTTTGAVEFAVVFSMQ